VYQPRTSNGRQDPKANVIIKGRLAGDSIGPSTDFTFPAWPETLAQTKTAATHRLETSSKANNFN